jgi:hypothetical protein
MTFCRKAGQLPEDASQTREVLDFEALDKQPLQSSEQAHATGKSNQAGLRLPAIEDSVVASALTIIAVLEFIGAPVAGFAVGSEDRFAGWIVFVGGVISGLILLGFARVIQNTFESSQRLKRIEMLMERSYDNDRAA